MKRLTLSILMIVYLAASAFLYGQIEITSSGNPYENEVGIAFDIDVSNLNLEQTGEQSWIFDQEFETIEGYNKRLLVDDSPYGDYFPESDWCVQALQYIPEINYELFPGSTISIADTLLDTYYYQTTGESFIVEDGMGFSHPFILDTVTAYQYPEQALTYPNPLTYESDPWTEYRQITIQQFILWTATITDSSIIEVDGWGDLTVPSGTYPCLKLKRTEKRNVYIEGLIDEDIITYTYLWLTYDYQPVLSVTGIDSANYTEALYVIRSESPISSPVICDPNCSPVAATAKDFVLKQNYPNPFNPTTTISYTLPENANIKLSVYSVLGQEVKTLYKGFQQQGSHQLTWNSRNQAGQKAPSGIYIYRLQINDANRSNKTVLTSKMILSK